MRALASVLFVVIAFHGAVHAQPGPDARPAQPAQPPQPSPYPYPPSQTYPGEPYPGQPYPGQPYPGQPYPGQPYPPPGGVVPPYQYAPVPLSPEDHELLNQGEISDGRHVGGILVSLFFGLGIGQAVQGRYGDTGWIFTLGEAGSSVAMIVGLVKTLDSCFDTFDDTRCNDNSTGQVLLLGGLIGLVVFRVWEVADAIGGPPKHNARVRQLRMQLGMPPTTFVRRLQPYLAPPLSRDGGATAGLTLRF